MATFAPPDRAERPHLATRSCVTCGAVPEPIKVAWSRALPAAADVRRADSYHWVYGVGRRCGSGWLGGDHGRGVCAPVCPDGYGRWPAFVPPTPPLDDGHHLGCTCLLY